MAYNTEQKKAILDLPGAHPLGGKYCIDFTM